MKTISIANFKGGVGKTVVAANLSLELARNGYCTVMIDLDPQSDLTKLFQAKNPGGYDIFDLLRKKCSPEEACTLIKDNLYLVRGSRDLIHYNVRNGEKRLVKCLADKSLSEVDFVIIDHPPNLNEYALAGFVASDYVVIVTDTEVFSMSNLGDLLENLSNIQATMGTSLSVLGIVANKVDMRRNITKRMLNELEKHFGKYALDTRISNDTSIPTSIGRGVSLRGLNWHSRTVGQFKALTEEVLGRVGITNGNE